MQQRIHARAPAAGRAVAVPPINGRPLDGRVVDTPAGANPIICKLGAFLDLRQESLAYLEGLQRNVQRFSPGNDLIVEGETCDRIFVLQEGWTYSYKMLPDGRRQILNFGLPGDFLGVRASLFETAEHSRAALTHVVVSSFPARMISEICRTRPEIAMAIQWASAREQAMLAEHLVSLGRRSAYERLAHLLLELLNRLQLVGLAGEKSYALPLTQEILADALGLSIVHVNRTLRKLRERGLVETRDRKVVIRNVERLSDEALFENDYLDQAQTEERRTAVR